MHYAVHTFILYIYETWQLMLLLTYNIIYHLRGTTYYALPTNVISCRPQNDHSKNSSCSDGSKHHDTVQNSNNQGNVLFYSAARGFVTYVFTWLKYFSLILRIV